MRNEFVILLVIEFCSFLFADIRVEHCRTPKCVIQASHLHKYLNPKIDPCENFYEFACGNYIKDTVIHDRFGESGVKTNINNIRDFKLEKLLKKTNHKSDIRVTQLAKIFFKDCNDHNTLNRVKADPLMSKFKQLGGWPLMDDNWNEENFEWREFIDRMYQLGYVRNYFIDFFMSVDPEDPSKYIPKLSQSIDMDYHRGYFKLLKFGLDNNVVQAYYDYMIDFTTLLGIDEAKSRGEMMKVLQFETELINISYIPTDVYQVAETINTLQEKYPNFDWQKFLDIRFGNEAFSNNNQKVLIYGQQFFQVIFRFLDLSPKRTVANYLFWRMTDYSKHYLMNDLKLPALKFFEKVYGVFRLQQGWQRCIGQAKLFFAPAFAAAFAREDDIKGYEKVTAIVESLRFEALELVGRSLRDISSSEKNKLLKEISLIRIKYEYPPEYFNDTALNEFFETTEVVDGKYYETVLKLEFFKNQVNKKKIFKNVFDTTKSFYSDLDGTFDTSAFSISKNSISIHPTELQYPYFDIKLPDYVNFAGLGSRIGLLLGFAIHSKMRAVRSESFAKYFNCIHAQYQNYIKINFGISNILSSSTLQSQADNFSIQLSYKAYISHLKRTSQKQLSLPALNFTSEQYFWILTAQQWCHINRDKASENKAISSTFPIESFRVIGPIQNQFFFGEDFSCKPGTEMNPINKCSFEN